MKLGQALEIFLRDQPIVDAVSKDLAEAKKTLKAHCRAKGLSTYRGVGYACVITQRLDTKAARAALGPKKAAECTVDVERETLTLPAHLRRGAVILDAASD